MKPRQIFDGVLAGPVRFAGGRPEVVLPLTRGMERAAIGQNELLRQQGRRGQRLSPRALWMFFLALTTLLSIFISATMLIRPGDIHPPVGVIALVSLHWLLVLNMVVSRIGPALLVDEDHLVIGAWPLQRREILLARLGTVLRPAFEISLAFTAVPLVVYAVVGRPPALAASALLLGLVIQTVGVAFGVTAALTALMRVLGRRRSQRLAALVADGNFFFLAMVPMMFLQDIMEYLQSHPRLLLAVPPAWFSAWGDLAAGPDYWNLAVVGLLASLLMVWAALRLLSPANQGARAETGSGRSARWHPARLLVAALAPAMRGREGWVMRRLLEAHLREDWRFVAGMATAPIVIGVMFFAPGALRGGAHGDILRITALTTVPFTHMIVLLAASFIFSVSFSSQPRALWIVALGNLDTRAIMAAQRAMIHGLIVLPVIVLYVIRAWMVGASWQVPLLDATILFAQVEVIVLLLQPRIRTMPFSQSYSSDHGTRRAFLILLMGIVSLAFVAMNRYYASNPAVRTVVWVALPAAWYGARRWSSRRLESMLLDMEAVTGR